MTAQDRTSPRPTNWLRVVAALATIFGFMTLFSGGAVLFGPQEAREAAGAYVPFVVWFNFLAGFAYVVAGIGIWIGAGWARRLAAGIAGATVLVALIFAAYVASGAEFEMRTVGALIFRTSVWMAIFVAIGRANR
jgi:cation transport ATPase